MKVEKKVDTKQSVLKGAMILSIGAMLSKVIGLVYRIPLNNIIGDVGNGLYSSVYQVYLIILTLTATAIPSGLSKLVAEREALGQHKEADRIFKLTLKYCLICSLVLTLVVCFGADFISDVFFPGENIAMPMRVLVPTILIATMVANFRGYFQGLGNMMPTAKSMVIEQVAHVISTVVLAYILIKISLLSAVAGAALGASVGSAVALIILLISYKKARGDRKALLDAQVSFKQEKESEILKRILVIIVPIIISSCVFSITTFIDLSIMSNFLPGSLQQLKDSGLIDTVPVPDAATYTMKDLATSLKGQYGYQYTTFINIPVALIVQLAAAVIPAISAAVALKDYNEVNNRIKEILKLGMLIGAPISVAFLLFGKPLVKLALFSNTGGEILSAGALSLVFITIAQLTAAVIQAMGKTMRASVHAIIACAIKIVVDYVLITIPSLNIFGVVYATTICYFLYAAFNIIYLYRHFKVKIDWMACVVKPILCASIMGGVSYLFYDFVFKMTGSMMLAMLPTIIIAMIIYFVIAILSKTITSDDLKQIPGGAKLGKLLKI